MSDLYYLEIEVFSNEMVPHHDILRKLMHQIHYELVTLNEEYCLTDVGVYFPDYSQEQRHFGNKVRLVGSENSLTLMHLKNAVKRKGLNGLVEVADIRPVPANIQNFVSVRRDRGSYQTKVVDDKSVEVWNRPTYPYINIGSDSNKNKFSLFVRQEPQENFVPGSFNTYGMTNKHQMATLPMW